MNNGCVLVIVGDDWVARLLATQLRSFGLEASSCSSGADAVLVATAIQPDCIIASMSLPELDGMGVVRAVRSEPAPLRNVAIIILCEDFAAPIHARVFQAGADAVIGAPYRTEDVALQAVALINMARRCSGNQTVSQSTASVELNRESTYPEATAIEGNLSQMSVATVLTLLEMERRSGYFKVSLGERRATIELVTGHAVGASLDRMKNDPITVLREILRWTEGRFHFKPGRDGPVPTNRVSIGALLLEAVRLDDETSREQMQGVASPPILSWPNSSSNQSVEIKSVETNMAVSFAPEKPVPPVTPQFSSAHLKPPPPVFRTDHAVRQKELLDGVSSPTTGHRSFDTAWTGGSVRLSKNDQAPCHKSPSFRRKKNNKPV